LTAGWREGPQSTWDQQPELGGPGKLQKHAFRGGGNGEGTLAGIGMGGKKGRYGGPVIKKRKGCTKGG